MKSNKLYYPELSPKFGELLEKLKGRKVVVLGHVRPDGDCIGSQVALCRVLRSQGIESVCVNRDPIPSTLKFLVGDTPFFLPENFDFDGWDAVSVDCADFRRMGPEVTEQLAAKPMGNIDHHISNTSYGEDNLVEGNSSAAGEILAGLFFDNDLPVDPITATALYVGIATDTGQFRFPSTTSHTFDLAGLLVEAGVNLSQVNIELYERESFARLDLLQHFLQSFSLHFNGRVCVGLLPDGSYEKVGASTEDSEGLVDYARSIDGVDIGVLVEENQGKIKGSLRAKEKRYRVDLIAKHFNGGGHAAAAGLNVDEKLDLFVPQLLAVIEQHLARVDAGEIE